MTGAPEATDAKRFPFTAARTGHGEAFLRPLLPMTVAFGSRSLEVAGLVDSGADINVLPFGIGTELGLEWSEQAPLLRLSGNLAPHEARGLLLDVSIGA